MTRLYYKKGVNLFLEFFDGVWGHYTFESDKVNVLIDGLPSFAYPFGTSNIFNTSLLVTCS